MQTVTTKAVLVAMPGQIFTFVATAGLAGTLTSITGSGTLTHDGSVYSSGTVGAVIAAGDEITIDVPPTGSITSMEIQQTLNVTGTTNLTDVVGPDQPGYLLGLSAGGVIIPVSPPTELTASNILSLVDVSGSNVEVTESGGLLAFTTPDAPPLTAGEISTLVHPDSNIVVEVEADQLKFTAPEPPEIPTTWNISVLRSGTTTANYGLRSKTDGTFELYALGPTGLYDSGGFAVAPVGLNEDLPNEGAPEWDLLSTQNTTADFDVNTMVDIQPADGTTHYDSVQQANSEWFVQFVNTRDFKIQQVRVGFSAGGAAGKTANYSLSIMDGLSVIATAYGVANSNTTSIDFTFTGLQVLPADGKLRLTRTSGDIEVLPQFRGNISPYNLNGIQTDWLARDSTGVAETSTAYPVGIGLNIALINDIHDPVIVEALSVTESPTEYTVTGMHLTRLNAVTSNSTTSNQHWILELTPEAHAHTGMLETLALAVSRDRSNPAGHTDLYYLARDSSGLELHRNSAGQIPLSSNTLQAVLNDTETYRFEFTATLTGTTASIKLTGLYRASDGLQILGEGSTITVGSAPNLLFCLVSGGNAGLTVGRGVNVGRPMGVNITRWVEWRI